MNPILYEPGAVDYQNNGIGILSDCISCEVTEARNGEYEATLQYPATGAYFSAIVPDAVVKVKANETSALQLFRIYKVSKPISGIVTVDAEHVSYRLNQIPVSPFSAESPADALSGLITHSAVANPFQVWTDIESQSGHFSRAVPVSARSCLGGAEGSILDVWGGEYEWDNYTVKLHRSRGADKGVAIVYGKNLLDLKQEETIASMVTGIYPYWTKEDELVELPEKVVQVQAAYSYPRVVPMDLSSNFEGKPTVEELRVAADAYLRQSGMATPKVSLTVDFMQLWQTAGYEDIAGMERVALCDTVSVSFARLGVSAKAKVVKTVYDTLAERYSKIELGDARTNLADTITRQEQEIAATPTTSFLESAIAAATAAITGASGGYVVLNPSKNPQEILIMDTPDIESATQVWRWNSGGLGHSGNGYHGPYSTAITQDGRIVADFITSGTLNASLANVINLNASNINTGSMSADRISAGVLKSTNNATIFDLNTGILKNTQNISGGIGELRVQNSNINMYVDGRNTVYIGHGIVTLQNPVDNGNRTQISDDGIYTRLLSATDFILTPEIEIQRLKVGDYYASWVQDPTTGRYYLGR